MSVEKKRQITSGYCYLNDHERDAIAVAISAYNTFKNKIRNIEKRVPAGLDVDFVKAEVIRGNSLKDIIKEEKEKKEEEGAPPGILGEIFKKVIEGDREGIVEPTEEALKSYEPMEVSDRALIPALDVVGKRFEEGKIFLPQMLRSAQAVQTAFEVLKKEMKKKGKKLKTGLCFAQRPDY
jgi:5-methyltetrahydrofolate--homocysteine methyltransferase